MRARLLRRLASAALLSTLLAIPLAYATAPAATAIAGGQPLAAEPGAASMLAGKLRFSLPTGFDRTALPPDGNRSISAVYLKPAKHQMVLTTESPLPDGQRVGDDDRAFLDAALAAHLVELDKPIPHYRELGAKSLTIKGLGLRQTDGRTTFFEQPVFSTSLIAGSGRRQATVVIMSSADDGPAHQALVAGVLASIAAGR